MKDSKQNNLDIYLKKEIFPKMMPDRRKYEKQFILANAGQTPLELYLHLVLMNHPKLSF